VKVPRQARLQLRRESIGIAERRQRQFVGKQCDTGCQRP
jgi:hypothetical protein